MVKWLVTVVLVLVAFSVIAQRFPRWRVPGDFRVPVRGRLYYIPIGSTILLSLAVWALGKLV
jgi:hypothetical protein